ncbi:DUF4153 domain-containing protein [Paenibacillus tarimensis]
MKSTKLPIMFNSGHRFLLCGSLLLAAIYVYFFYDKTAGISVPLFAVLLFAAFGRFNRLSRKNRSSHRAEAAANLLFLVPAGLLALTYALYTNPMFRVLNFWVMIMLAGAYTVIVSGKSDHRWFEWKFAGNVLHHLIPAVLRSVPVPFLLTAHLLSSGTRSGASSEQNNELSGKGGVRPIAKRIGLGLVISFLPLIVVILLLASADMMFAEMLDGIPEYFLEWNVPDAAGRLFLFITVALYLFCYGWGLAVSDDADKNGNIATESAKAVRRFDPVVTGTVLLMLNSVYVCFAAIQFSYFFSAGDGALPIGSSYAEYARRGFAELVMVTVINLSIVLIVLRHLKREPGAGGGHITTRLLLTLIVGATGVMLVSAFLRLTLYEEAHGFTTTRILVHAFMIYLAILFLVAFVQVWRSQGSIIRMYIILSIAAYVAVNYMNVDKMVAERNVARYEVSGKIDTYYLYNLSYDAIPALMKLYRSENKPPDLTWLLNDKKKFLQTQQISWTSWNASVAWAKRQLNAESFKENLYMPETQVRGKRDY